MQLDHRASQPWMRRLFRRAACAAAFVATSLGAAAQAPPREIYALVIGASNYEVPGLRPLKGPKNDVTLLVNTLLDDGVPRGSIRVLADDVASADYQRKVSADGRPGKKEIVDGLRWLAERPDLQRKQVLIYLSGHGLQVPEHVKGNELDGLDEAYVPIDAGVAPAGSRIPTNLLLDDEIEEHVKAIRAKGAFVWLVADSCNSGTISRTGDADRAARKANAAALGVSSDAIEAARSAAAGRGTSSREASDVVAAAGRFVGFYAAMPEQVAYETLLPRNSSAPMYHGVLTWTLVQAIRQQGAASYGALALRVAAGYADWGGGATSPLFEGELAAAPMLGAGGDPVFAVSAREGQLYLRSGLVDGVTAGATLALLDPLGEPKPLAIARVASAGVVESKLEVEGAVTDPKGLIARVRSAPPATPAAPQGDARSLVVETEGAAAGDAPLAARIVSRPVSFTLRVAQPALLDPASASSTDTALLAQARTALAKAAQPGADPQPVDIAIAAPGQPADIYPLVDKGRLHLFAAGADVGASAPAIAAPDAELATRLRAIARGQNLLRVLEAASASPISRAISVDVFVLPKARPLADACEQPDYAEVVPAAARAVQSGVAPAIGHCDGVYIRLTNTGSEALSVTSLFLSSWGETSFLGGYREDAVSGLPLRPGEERVIHFVMDLSPHSSPTPPGRTQILLIAVPAAGASYPSFSYLGEPVEPPSVRGGGAFGDTLRQAAYANARLRSGTSASDDRGGGLVIPLSIAAH